MTIMHIKMSTQSSAHRSSPQSSHHSSLTISANAHPYNSTSLEYTLMMRLKRLINN